MLETAILLLMNSLLLMLRISPGDSFPRPLSREQEQAYLEQWEKGDVEARNMLVEHNLRLVAHIIKKGYHEREILRKGSGQAGTEGKKPYYIKSSA